MESCFRRLYGAENDCMPTRPVVLGSKGRHCQTIVTLTHSTPRAGCSRTWAHEAVWLMHADAARGRQGGAAGSCGHCRFWINCHAEHQRHAIWRGCLAGTFMYTPEPAVVEHGLMRRGLWEAGGADRSCGRCRYCTTRHADEPQHHAIWSWCLTGTSMYTPSRL
jgi:hypothetical protein